MRSRPDLPPTSSPRYERDGYLLVPRMFDDEEIGLLLRSAKEDRALDAHSYGKDDGEGGRVRLSLWNHPGDGIYGMFARCRRMVDACEQILDDEVYHYHSKMIMKDAKVGGAWTWHQDYGYWYQNGVLFPDLVSVFIAVDPSHQGERLPPGDQGLAPAGPDRPRPDRPASRRRHGPGRGDPQAAAARCTSRCVPATPSSSIPTCCTGPTATRRSNPRWSMICCYNARHNDPYKEAHHPRYTPLSKVDDRMIREVGIKRFADDPSDVAWLDPEVDVDARSLDRG